MKKAGKLSSGKKTTGKHLNIIRVPSLISPASIKGEILNTVARLQKKLKLDNEAIETYDLISNDYPEVLIQKKIPLGAVALLEKSLLYLGKNDTVSALKTVHLYESNT